MPVLLKNKSQNSPGIISFTHGEALFGVPAKFKKVSNFLCNKSKKNEWIFGIHIQGDISWMKNWIQKDWQDFFMWSNKEDSFLKSLPKNRITELTCINFYDKKIQNYYENKKYYDLCCITRFSSLKKTKLTLEIFKNILKKNINSKLLFISPVAEKNNNYQNEILISIKKFFTPKELEQIDFICNSQKYFGNFPISDNLIYKLISSSSNLILNSHQEGVPRVIIEALMLNCKIIVSDKLKSGINNILTNNNSFIYKDNENAYDISNQIFNFIKNNINFAGKDLIDRNNYLAEVNIPKFKEFIKTIYDLKNIVSDYTDDNWYLKDLPKRLACHNNMLNFTFMNNYDAFFKWFEKIENITSIDQELETYIDAAKLDKKTKYFSSLPYYYRLYLDKFKYKIFKIN